MSLRNRISSIYLSNRAEGRKRHLLIFELLVVSCVYLISFMLWDSLSSQSVVFNTEFILLGIYNLFSWILLYRLTIIAKLPRTQRYIQIFFNFARVAFLELTILFVLKYIFGFASVSYIFLFIYAGLNFFILFHLRVFTYRLFKTYRAKGYDIHKVIVIADTHSESLIEKIMNNKDWGFKIVKIMSDSPVIRYKYGKDITILPESADLKNLIDNEVVDEVILAKRRILKDQLKELTGICNEVGVIFRQQSGLSSFRSSGFQFYTMNNAEMLTLIDTPSSNLAQFYKQVTDLYFSFLMLLFLFPVFLIIALLIKLDSRGPVFFKQERVGLRGRRFKLYKFRSMVTDAEKILANLSGDNEVDGPVFKIRNDPRITRIGRILRKTGLDELPQLYNVFRGEMSLIGPRPPLPSEVVQYERWQLRRLSVKPGITCTWQVIPNRNDIKFENWMKLDLQYIDNWSLQKDFGLLIRTVKTIIFATGH
ncbi:MAG TPA: sugar transferase [Bacteroidales bacterium]|nr:sugar transferase [Bacteroidales bacterium]